MQDSGHQPPGRTGHGTAAFHLDGYIGQTGRAQDFIVGLLDALAYSLQIHRLLLRAIRNAYAAAQINKFQLNPQLVLDFHSQIKHQLRRIDKALGAALIGNNHGMQAKTLYALCLCQLVGLKNLVISNTILCLSRLADNIVALNQIARIVAERHALWHTGMLVQILDMRNIVKVYNSSQLNCLLELICRSIVRGQHDILPYYASRLRQKQLRQGTAIAASTLLCQHLNQPGIRGSLHGKMLLKLRSPAERRLQLADIVPDSLFVINMKRCRILGNHCLQLFLG